MPLATRNGQLIVKDGKLAENCNCCGEWWCFCETPAFGSLCNFTDVTFVGQSLAPSSYYWNGILGAMDTWVIPRASYPGFFGGIKTVYESPGGPPSIYAHRSNCDFFEYGMANPRIDSLSYRQYLSIPGSPVCAPSVLGYVVYKCRLSIESSTACTGNTLRATWSRRVGVREVLSTTTGTFVRDAGQFFYADDSFAPVDVTTSGVTVGTSFSMNAPSASTTTWLPDPPSVRQGGTNLTAPTSLDSKVHPFTPYQVTAGPTFLYDSLYSLTYRQMRDAVISQFPAPTLSLRVTSFSSTECA